MRENFGFGEIHALDAIEDWEHKQPNEDNWQWWKDGMLINLVRLDNYDTEWMVTTYMDNPTEEDIKGPEVENMCLCPDFEWVRADVRDNARRLNEGAYCE